MPNRTIYVADADVPIFEKAQELAGVEGEGDRVGCGAVCCITRKRDVNIQL